MSTGRAHASVDRRYKSEAAARRIRTCYRALLETVDRPVERRWVETPAGVTHVLEVGPADAPPLVVFHGGNTINPVTLPWFLPLADNYRILAPDTIGQPGFSAPTRLDPTSLDYGRWVASLLDGLEIDSARMLGLSYGAGILLQAAAVAPSRIDRAALIVPSGLSSPPWPALLAEVAVPFLRYRLVPSRTNLLGLLEVLCADPETALDPLAIDAIEAVIRGVRVERKLPKVVTAEELSDFEAPTLVAVASDDVLFPPEQVLPQAKEVISNLEVVMRLADERHIPGPAARETMRRYLRPFFDGESKRP